MKQALHDESRSNQGFLLTNLLHFGRMLRESGIPVSSQQIFELAEGITYIDISQKEDFYNTTRAYLLYGIDFLDKFNIVFDLFWSHQIKAMMEFFVGHQSVDSKSIGGLDTQDENNIPQNGIDPSIISSQDKNIYTYLDEAKVNPIYSPLEALYQKDFSEFDEGELIEAKKIINNLFWQLDQQWTRRRIRAFKKTHLLDFRRSFRTSMTYGGELFDLEWRRRKFRPRPLVVLCDISGSMENYSKILLHFLYSLVQNSRRVEAFAFATRLTRLTPTLRRKNVDSVLNGLSTLIYDWSGGTRIGESLKAFNYQWARRVLSRGVIVVIISDGWDRGDIGLLKREVSRLKRSSSHLIWLNPVAGSQDYEPLVRGIQTVLPFVDDFFPFNNLQSIGTLAGKLSSIESI